MDIKVEQTWKAKLELEKWEVADLVKILDRINRNPSVSKSEFSLREKATARRLLDGLHRRL
jgi:hypothetical protein